MVDGKYDFGIVGAGGSGLAAAMYAARLGLKTCVFGSTKGIGLPIGGTITNAGIVENYPGIKSTSGISLSKQLEEHARSYDLVQIKQEMVLDLKKRAKEFLIKTDKGEYIVKTVLFATGTKWKELDIKGSKEFDKKGVNYCALCDAPLYKGKIVAVLGGGNVAAKDSLILAEHAKKVYLIYRGTKIRPEHDYLRRIEKSKKIEIINKTNIKEIKGNRFVTSIVLDKPYNGSKELKVDGVFIAIGSTPLSELVKELGVKLNKKLEIIINPMTSETNIEGIFAAGDVTNRPYKQLIMGVADGCTAAYSAYDYLKRKA